MKLKELLDAFYKNAKSVTYYAKAGTNDVGIEKLHRYSFLSNSIEDKEVLSASMNSGYLLVCIDVIDEEKEFNPDVDDY